MKEDSGFATLLEDFGILIAAAGVAVIGYLAHLGRAASRLEKKKRPNSRRVTRPNVVPEPLKTTEMAPFDRQSGHALEAKEVICGKARIIDGDSLIIRKTQIRLFGVDAPEINHPYGQKAKWALVNLCKGLEIRAEIIEKDAHDRTVAHCSLPDGRDLSAEMVKLGLAIDWPKFSGGKYRQMEPVGIRKKLWLADARQKGRMHVWAKFEASQRERSSK